MLNLSKDYSKFSQVEIENLKALTFCKNTNDLILAVDDKLIIFDPVEFKLKNILIGHINPISLIQIS
jgi:hypothetical protein